MPKSAKAAAARHALPLFTSLPKGHRTVFVDDGGSEPLLQKGQYAVINTADRKPRHRELYAIQSRSPFSDSAPYVKVVVSDMCDIGRGRQRVWWIKNWRGWRQVGSTVHGSRQIPVFGGLMDGPYETSYVQRKLLLGCVVGYAMSPLGKPVVRRRAA